MRCFGTFFDGDTPIRIPKYPFHSGDLLSHKHGAPLTIQDTEPNLEYMVRWVQVGSLLIADRCLLCNISFDELCEEGIVPGRLVTVDGLDFKLRLLQTDSTGAGEWEHALAAAGADNETWNWAGMYFWVDRNEPQEPMAFAKGNLYAKKTITAERGGNSYAFGFRPVLEMIS